MLRNVLIVVKDIEKAVDFYKELLGLTVAQYFEGKVIMTEGLVLQEIQIWKDVLGKDILPRNHCCELYFEERDIETFVERLNNYKEPIEYVTPFTTMESGRKLVRFYDPDGNLIEVGCWQ